MLTIVKGIKYCLLVLMFFSALLLLWNIEYVTFRTTDHNHHNSHGTTTTDTQSSIKGNVSSAGLAILYIPKIKIQFSSKTIKGSVTADNVKLIKGNTNTNQEVRKVPHPPSSKINTTVVKLDDPQSPIKFSSVRTDKKPTHVNELNATTETPQTPGYDLPMTTDNLSTNVDTLSVTENSTMGGHALSVSKDKGAVLVTKLSVTTDSLSTNVGTLSVTENSTMRGHDLSVSKDKEAVLVTNLPLTTDKPIIHVDNVPGTKYNQKSDITNVSMQTDNPITLLDDLLQTTYIPSTHVDDLSLTTESPTTPVIDVPMRTEIPPRREKDVSGSPDNPASPIIDLSKTQTKTTGVNKTPVKVDKPLSRMADVVMKKEKRTSHMNDTAKFNVKDNPNDQWTKLRYPLEVDMVQLVRKVKSNIPVDQKPIFPYRYSFSHHRIDKCVSGSPYFIFLIKSAVNNTKSRTAIRETWAHNKLQKKYNFVRIFLVGSSDEKSVNSAIKRENYKYRDVIQMSFRDNYYNNTLKTIGAIHWTVKHCNRSKFVVFVDDDMLVSPKSLYTFIHTKVTGPTYFGGHINEQHPQREKGDKWFVSVDDYPHDIYPPMPSGGFLIMTMNFVIDLHYASQFTKKFIYDDVYLAILAYKLHVRPTNIPKIYMRPIKLTNRLLYYSIAVHGFEPTVLKQTWNLFKRLFVSRGNIN